MMVIAIDITGRKTAEEDRLRLATAVEQAAECIIITDRETNIQYVNPAFEKITGHQRSDVIGKTPRILKSGQHDEAFYHELYRTITSGETWRGQFTDKKKDGTLYEEEATISPVKNAAGEITNFVAVKRDVTDEKKLERYFRQAQRLQAMGTLASGIAHSFNNIIQMITGNTHLAMEGIKEDSEERLCLDNIIIASDRASDLVNKIFTFNPEAKETRKPVHLQPLISEGIRLLRSSLPLGVKIKENLNGISSTILADPVDINQLLLNLGTNAGHAMEKKGGEVFIGINEVELDPKFLAAYPQKKPGVYVDVEVKDTGQGMKPQILDRIFEPFFTTRKAAGGTGMGLAVVHGIVKSHEGILTVDSEVNVGTTFHVYFPKLNGAQ